MEYRRKAREEWRVVTFQSERRKEEKYEKGKELFLGMDPLSTFVNARYGWSGRKVPDQTD